MIELTQTQRDLLRAAIDLALNLWDKDPENAELHPIDDLLIEADRDHLQVVVFKRRASRSHIEQQISEIRTAIADGDLHGAQMALTMLEGDLQ